ncbi:hypothetical protein L195_g028875, partial [Trifolium pratense]
MLGHCYIGIHLTGVDKYCHRPHMQVFGWVFDTNDFDEVEDTKYEECMQRAAKFVPTKGKTNMMRSMRKLMDQMMPYDVTWMCYEDLLVVRLDYIGPIRVWVGQDYMMWYLKISDSYIISFPTRDPLRPAELDVILQQKALAK